MILFCQFVLLIFLSIVQRNSVISQPLCTSYNDDFFAAQVFLFFAPMGESSAVRQQIAIYYHNPGFIPGDKIHVYSNDNGGAKLNLIRTFYPSEMKGIWMTNITPNKLFYDIDAIYKTDCLGYFASWSRNITSYTSNCLSTHPDWMGTRKSLFWDKRIQDMFIPGTHNSGAYSEDEPQSYIQKLTVTQDHDVFQQLISGARYIDLRPSKYNGSYWVNHGPLHRMNRMDDIIDDVIQFMNNTEEIVILSFKEFPYGFYTIEDHRMFSMYLQGALADYILPWHDATWRLTLGEIWDLGKRLILSYDFHMQYDMKMWPPIEQDWPNAQNLGDLRTYLMSSLIPLRSPIAVMAEITLDVWTVLKNLPANLMGDDTGSLRRFGTMVGPNITAMYYENLHSYANIVAVDYLDATGIVDVAIEWNERRVSPCFSYYQLLMLIVRKSHHT